MKVCSRCIILFVILGIHFSCENDEKVKNQKNPNVLFISVDDLNTWLGCLNKFSNTKTPNIDKLAARGVLFSNAHCQAPLCGPSRASIMTGLRPSTTGMYGMTPDEQIRSDNPATKDIIFLPEYYKKNGYHTMGIGKLFHVYAPKGIFDEEGGRVRGFGPHPKKRLSGMVMELQKKERKNMDGPIPIGAHFLKQIPRCPIISLLIGQSNE
jgi:hypothetical protein